MIPFVDFGGAGPLLHLAHGNGYPPGAYRPLIGTLTPRFRVLAMLTRPFWPDCPPNGLQDWQPLADDFLRFLDERAARDVIGVGHSLGAVTTLMAALRRPGLFRALVMIDPVLLPYSALYLWEIAHKLGLAHRLHPLIPSTRRRQRVFESVEAMYASYRQKPVFSRIDDDGLRACVEALARPRPDGQVELAYPPEWEARIYLVGPLVERKLWPQVKNLRPPLLVVRGKETDAFMPAAARMMQARLPRAVIHTVEGAGHLAPLERPEEVGQIIRAFLESV
jgi:pimeloyl-ACP methyl ester carboxylesterase